MSEPRLTKTWDVSAFDRVNNEWTTTQNHAYDTTPEVTPDMFINQAQPTVIRPGRRVRGVPEGDRLLFIGDHQFPFTDPRKLALAQIAIQEIQPTEITFMGDELDLPLHGKWERRQEWAGTTQTAIDQFHEYLAQTRANAGKETKILVHDGNHTARLETDIRKMNGELLGIRQANSELGVLTIPFLLRLAELDIEWVGGYPNDNHWHRPALLSHHGVGGRGRNGMMTQAISRVNYSVVNGHGHGAELVFRTFMGQGGDPETVFGMNTGTMANTNGNIPSGSYSTDEHGNVTRQIPNWQSAVGVVYSDEDTLRPYLLPITQDGIDIHGKLYRS
jgi:hypothetical protein